jgi:hypothetical protein
MINQERRMVKPNMQTAVLLDEQRYVALGAMSPESSPASFAVAVCGTGSVLCHSTVSPCLMVSDGG